MSEQVNLNFTTSKNFYNSINGQIFCLCIIGANITGKTFLAIDIAQKQKNEKRYIIGFDPMGKLQKSGLLDYKLELTDNWASELMEKNKKSDYKFKNSLLILDDYRILHPNDNINSYFSDLLELHIEMNMNIIYICHNPMLILEKLGYSTTDYSIFYTNTNEGCFECTKLPNNIQCQKAVELISQYVEKYDITRHTDFPFIHVAISENVQSEIINLNLTNINQDKWTSMGKVDNKKINEIKKCKSIEDIKSQLIEEESKEIEELMEMEKNIFNQMLSYCNKFNLSKDGIMLVYDQAMQLINKDANLKKNIPDEFFDLIKEDFIKLLDSDKTIKYGDCDGSDLLKILNNEFI